MITIAGVRIFFVNILWSLVAGKKAPPIRGAKARQRWNGRCEPAALPPILDAAEDRLTPRQSTPRLDWDRPRNRFLCRHDGEPERWRSPARQGGAGYLRIGCICHPSSMIFGHYLRLLNHVCCSSHSSGRPSSGERVCAQ
jgi:hypothetical protein